jgi:hypothetical protein
MVTPKVVMSSSRELQHPLLCEECDGSLSRDGENWVLPLLATIDQSFPMFELLKRSPPDVGDEDAEGYAAARNPEIDIAKLTHFALGVFWKASVHSWSGSRADPQIELGPYREELRKFLRGEGPFPKYMSLTVGVLPPPVTQISFCQPYLGSAKDYHLFIFYVPGIAFALAVGKGIGDVKENCFYSNPLHPIVVCDFSGNIKSIFQGMFAKAHKSKNLVEYLQKHVR